jgi:hypothetical protein
VNETRYYKGKYKVKIVTESVGYLTVEALEDFEDIQDGKKITVKTGERRIVPIDEVQKERVLPTMVKEHVYELNMEKKVKQMVAEGEKTEKAKAKRKS